MCIRESERVEEAGREVAVEFMQLTKEQYQKIEVYLPVQRGNVKMPNLQMLNAILYMAENGCKWRNLPYQFGLWNTIYQRMSRRTKNGVLNRVFEKLEDQMDDPPEALSMDSTSIKVHPDGTGALKNSPQSIGKSHGGWTAKIPMLAAKERQAGKFALSPGNAHDAPEGHKLLRKMRDQMAKAPLLMDRAYEGDKNRQQAQAMGLDPVVPPLRSCRNPWKYDRELYKKHNEVERLFRRLKGYRRVFSCFDKLAGTFMGFIMFALIFEMLH